MTKKRPEDQLLVEDQFPELNAAFYKAEPADYFERRMQLLVLQAGNPAGIEGLLKEGVEVGKLKLTGDGEFEGEEVARSVQHYAATEAELLRHQVGETVLRLYLAHAFEGRRPPQCPRLDMARLRHGSDFADRIESRFMKADIKNEANRRALANVFHLTGRREAFGEVGPPEDAWDESLRLHELYLRFWADQYLSGGPLYNAAKHGLAVTPSEFGVEFAGILKRDLGPVVRYLTIKRTANDPVPRWHDAVHWVDVDTSIALTYRAITQLRMLWGVARYRYTSPKSDRARVGILAGPGPHELIMQSLPDSAGGFHLSDISFELAYWKRENEPKSPEE